MRDARLAGCPGRFQSASRRLHPESKRFTFWRAIAKAPMPSAGSQTRAAQSEQRRDAQSEQTRAAPHAVLLAVLPKTADGDVRAPRSICTHTAKGRPWRSVQICDGGIAVEGARKGEFIVGDCARIRGRNRVSSLKTGVR
jgi:hypothetical protein